MVGYELIEKAVVRRALDHFPHILNENRCKSSDIDAVFSAMISEDATYGCVIDFKSSGLRARAPFKEDMWGWDIVGVFFIRYRGDQELLDKQTREVIDGLSKMFADPVHKRLHGLVPLALMRSIDQPEAEMINDVPLYWIPFLIEVLDK